MELTHDEKRSKTNKRSTSAVDVVVLGGASTDCIAYGPRLPGVGEEVEGHMFCQVPGGKGANQALAVARLGATVAFVARVGADDRGDAVLEHLNREGVDTRCCLRDPDEQTSAILLMVDHEGTKQTLTVPGATGRLSTDDVAHAAEVLAQTQLLLVQFEAPLSTVLHAIALAHRFGRPVFLDTAPAVSVPEDIWGQVYLVRANAREASVHTGIEVCDANTARQAAKRFFAWGVRVVAIQAGSEGNVLMWYGGEVFLSSCPPSQSHR